MSPIVRRRRWNPPDVKSTVSPGECVVRVRAKICGITTVGDAAIAAAAGCDAVGINFYPGSPRCVSAQVARDIAASLPPFVTPVGIFVDAEPERIEAVLRQVPLGLLQFNGDEPPAACERFGVPYAKVISVRKPLDVTALEQHYGSAAAFLLDTFDPAARGGTGRTFDWSLWPANPIKPLVLAGGLTPDNVCDAIRRLRPYGVDVSSGVENEVKGVKSPEKVRAFMDEVRRGGNE